MVPGLRGGRPLIRGRRLTVGDVMGWLASRMSVAEVLEDFPDLTEIDIRAASAFAAKRERITTVAAECRDPVRFRCREASVRSESQPPSYTAAGRPFPRGLRNSISSIWIAPPHIVWPQQFDDRFRSSTTCALH